MIFEKSIKKQSKKRKEEGGGAVEGVGALDNIKKRKLFSTFSVEH